MGRLPTLQLMALKAAHYHELLGMITGYKRPLAATTLRPARDNCESCHWPEVNHADRVRTKVHFDADAKNTETRTRLVVHTGSGEARDKATRGIHWHIAQNVEYVTDDLQKRTIPWVEHHAARTARPTTYFDATSKVPCRDGQEGEAADGVRDCHNAAGHPFINPADRVDHAIAEGQDRPQPAVDQGARARDHREGSPLHGPMEEQVPKFEQIIADAAPKGELNREAKEAETKFADDDAGDPEAHRVRGEGPHVEVVPEPRRPQRLPRLLPLPRWQAHEREGRGDAAAMHAVPRPPAGQSDGRLKTVASTVAPA